MSQVQQQLIAPVVKTVRVNANAARAFEVFATNIGRWWPADHHIGLLQFADIVIEPQLDGRFYEVDADGVQRDWGRVLAYQPGQRLLLAWQLDADWEFDPNFEVEVEVTFTALGDQTEVRLEHRNLERYGRKAGEVRMSVSGEGGWPKILGCYCACCAT